MNSVVMSIRGLLSSELWVPTLLVVPVSSGRNHMVPGGSGGSGGSGDSEIVGFDWSYQSQIRKWYFVIMCLRFVNPSCARLVANEYKSKFHFTRPHCYAKTTTVDWEVSEGDIHKETLCPQDQAENFEEAKGFEKTRGKELMDG